MFFISIIKHSKTNDTNAFLLVGVHASESRIWSLVQEALAICGGCVPASVMNGEIRKYSELWEARSRGELLVALRSRGKFPAAPSPRYKRQQGGRGKMRVVDKINQ